MANTLGSGPWCPQAKAREHHITLSHLSVVHMAIYPGKPLLALLSEPLSSSIQTSQCHPLNAVNQDH